MHPTANSEGLIEKLFGDLAAVMAAHEADPLSKIKTFNYKKKIFFRQALS
jgi:hypothetical protein